MAFSHVAGERIYTRTASITKATENALGKAELMFLAVTAVQSDMRAAHSGIDQASSNKIAGKAKRVARFQLLNANQRWTQSWKANTSVRESRRPAGALFVAREAGKPST